ncbi:Gfo/Idh/MocA family protein [Winogradskyella sp. R77965]|uniref:Gfo/Idh/MocA family protein n=1 Tax=Winogradskyella sp. R77965 TaxID=3093872 RepID=UPI0037DBF57A
MLRKGVCVGLGYFSQFHLEAWSRLKEVEITAVCDFDKEKLKKVALEHGIRNTYTNVKEMLVAEQPDFVDIITPPETHLELCLLAIKHKVNIICQKPLAPTLKEGRQISEAIRNSDIRMMVHENFRFQPWHTEIKKLISENTIGDLFAINARLRTGDGWQEDAYMNRQPYFRKMEKLLMYETGIHYIDLMHFYAGKITNVYARLKRLNKAIEGEDFGWIQFDFENECTAFLDANRYNESTCENPRLTFGKFLIEGSKGTIRLYEDGKITVQLLGEQESEHNYKFEDINFAGDCVYFTQKHFVKQLNSGDPFHTSVYNYLKNLVVLDKVYESSMEGIPKEIKN